MVKFMTEIIGNRVLLFQERIEVGPILDLIIDPLDGAFLGFFVIDAGERKKKVVPVSEIKAIGSGFILIKDLRSLSEEDDVVKIKEALKINPKIIGERVETESGQFLGKVNNATINLKMAALERIYITPPLSIKYFSEDLIISAKKIIEIKKDKIIVSDEYLKVGSKVKLQAAVCPE